MPFVHLISLFVCNQIIRSFGNELANCLHNAEVGAKRYLTLSDGMS